MKTIKYPEITLTKEVKDLYDENYETLLTEIEKGTKKWKATPYPWIGRSNIIKMSIFLRVIYKFNAIPMKVPPIFFKRI